MAKRYIRINNGLGWANKPSTATQISAGNLNHMDKGIDDLDNAIEDLYNVKIDKSSTANNLVTTEAGLVLDARQGKVLKDGVDELNNNLAQYYKVYNVVDVGGGILKTAGKIIGVTNGKVSYVYLITITDSVGDYYCGIHFYRPTISHAIVKLGGGLDVVVNNQGTVSPTNGTASYEFSVCLLSAK